jgi:hypothetical protein
MDHAISWPQFCQGSEDLLFARLREATSLDARAKDLLFGDDSQFLFRKAETARDVPGEDIYPPVATAQFGREIPLGYGKRQLIVAEKFMEAFCLAFLVAYQDHPPLLFNPRGELLDQGPKHSFAVRGDGEPQIRVVTGGEADGLPTILSGQLKVGNFYPSATFKPLADLFHGEEEVGAIADYEILFSSILFGDNQFSCKFFSCRGYPFRIGQNRNQVYSHVCEYSFESWVKEGLKVFDAGRING